MWLWSRFKEVGKENEAVKFPKVRFATSFRPHGVKGTHLATNTTNIY